MIISEKCWSCGHWVDPDERGQCPKCHTQLTRFDMRLRIIEEEDSSQEPPRVPADLKDPIKQKEAELANQFHEWLKDKEILPGGYTFTTQRALVGDLSRQRYGLKLLLIAEKDLDLTQLLEHSGFELSPTDYRATLGFNLAFRDYERIEYQIRVLAWSILPPYIPYFLTHYRGAHGALFFYDVDKKQALDQIPSLLGVVQDINSDIPAGLVGYKLSQSGRRQVTRKAAQALAEQLEMLYYETRSPNGPNLDPILDELVPQMLNFAKF